MTRTLAASRAGRNCSRGRKGAANPPKDSKTAVIVSHDTNIRPLFSIYITTFPVSRLNCCTISSMARISRGMGICWGHRGRQILHAVQRDAR